MIFYTIHKGKELVGLGSTVFGKLPDDTKSFTHKKITEVVYNKLLKTEFNGEQRVSKSNKE